MKFRKSRFALLLLFVVTSICSAATRLHFSSVLERQPEKVWSPKLDSKTRVSLNAYQQHLKLPNGLIYGEQIRSLQLRNLCQSEIMAWAKKNSCQLKTDFVKHPQSNEPKTDRKGNTIPLLSWICQDGGVIRMKPLGDPTSQYSSRPEAVKAMRQFGSDQYANFSDEAFKVDDAGLAIPKWPKDLNLELPGLRKEDRQAYLDEWASDAHSPLKPCP